MAYSPTQYHNEVRQTFTNILNAYHNAGLQPEEEFDDTMEARKIYFQNAEFSGKVLTNYRFAPDPANGKIIAFKRDPSKMIQAGDAQRSVKRWE